MTASCRGAAVRVLRAACRVSWTQRTSRASRRARRSTARTILSQNGVHQSRRSAGAITFPIPPRNPLWLTALVRIRRLLQSLPRAPALHGQPPPAGDGGVLKKIIKKGDNNWKSRPPPGAVVQVRYKVALADADGSAPMATPTDQLVGKTVVEASPEPFAELSLAPVRPTAHFSTEQLSAAFDCDLRARFPAGRDGGDAAGYAPRRRHAAATGRAGYPARAAADEQA